VHIFMGGGIILMLYWLVHDLQGFGGTGDALFDFHPLFMFTAFPILLSETIILPAVWVLNRKTHIVLHLIILCLAFTGFGIIVQFHLQEGYDNFVSVHAYCGLSTLSLLFAQNLVGSLMYWCQCRESTRVAYGSKHRFFGVVIFIMALATVTLGLFDKQSLIESSDQVGTAKLIPNILAVLVISIGIMTLYIANDKDPEREQVENRLRAATIPLQSENGDQTPRGFS